MNQFIISLDLRKKILTTPGRRFNLTQIQQILWT